MDELRGDRHKVKDGEEGFPAVTTRVEEIICEQKFTGAAAGLFNPNIIARDLGLKDKKEHLHTGSGSHDEVDYIVLADRLQFLINKGKKAKAIAEGNAVEE